MKFVPGDATITAAEVLTILDARIAQLEEAIEYCTDDNYRVIYDAKLTDATVIRYDIIAKLQSKVPEIFAEERAFA